MSRTSKQRRASKRKQAARKKKAVLRQTKLKDARRKAHENSGLPTEKVVKNSAEVQCYMCARKAVSVEHIPPKCLFPEVKDVTDGKNYRENLITVPACSIHNQAKSQNDEYLRNVLVMNLPTNKVGKNQFFTKVMRGIERRPKLMQSMLDGHQKVQLQHQKSGEVQQTIAINVDMDRFESTVEMMVRGLHFHHFGKKCFREISIHPTFLLSMGTNNSVAINQDTQNLSDLSEKFFSESEIFGNNPEVFSYQVQEVPEKSSVVYKLNFYGGCSITAFLTPRKK